MAIKKSELYSSIWSSCDKLRSGGGMDASQYKDYVLTMLFIKYISDKCANQTYAEVTVPKGASFADMVKFKGKSDVGDLINKKIIQPLATKNKLSGMPDFDDSEKLGRGKARVETLTKLIAIFENPALDFSKNRADNDDLLGDAYEYLMRHFATQSGKSKGQFYTPSEVSRIMAKIIGINNLKTTAQTTVYDPTCGSVSLLLKVAHEVDSNISLYGQEKDVSTVNLAKMNCILHNHASARIKQGNTLSEPLFIADNNELKRFDYIVANPPFSDKDWQTGVNIENDEYGRFKYGTPPTKNGDYAYLLHIIRSLKSNGKGACILPHGVLFRGNSEANIRTKLIRQGWIKSIIGLPTNLFYGTSIPACIILIDKENSSSRKSVFIVDASKGFIKDGNKNRLREMDIHKIIDVVSHQKEIENYSKIVALKEIEHNDFNLNIPRYIDSGDIEDLHDIEAHLLGDIPNSDIDKFSDYWNVLPSLKSILFTPANRSADYMSLKIDINDINKVISTHQEFISYIDDMHQIFNKWQNKTSKQLRELKKDGFIPKNIIRDISEALLRIYDNKPLINNYDVYQYLMNYWHETMQDDCYLILTDYWQANTHRVLVKNQKNKEVDKGWTCDLVPKKLVIKRYFNKEQQIIDNLHLKLENIQNQKTALAEENTGEECIFFEWDKINKTTINIYLNNHDFAKDNKILTKYLGLLTDENTTNKKIREAEKQLDDNLFDFYPKLTVKQIKQLVIDDKWMPILKSEIDREMMVISQDLTTQIKALAQRYETPLPKQMQQVEALEKTVNGHLEKMGFVW